MAQRISHHLFSELPSPVETRILSFSDDQTIASCTRLNRAGYQAISQNRELWEALFKRAYPRTRDFSFPEGVRKTYARRRCFSAHTAEAIFTRTVLQEHPDTVTKLLVATDGRLITGCADCRVRIWEEIKGNWECVDQILGLNHIPIHLHLESDGRLFVGLASGQGILCKKIDNKWEFQEVLNHKNSATCFQLGSDGRLFIGFVDGSVKIHQEINHKWECVQTLQAHAQRINCFHLDAINRSLFTGSEDGTVKIWKIREGGAMVCVQTLRLHRGSISSLQLEEDGRLFTGSIDGSVGIWKKIDNTWTDVGVVDNENRISHLQLDAHTGRLFICCVDGRVKIWKEEDSSGIVWKHLHTLANHQDWVWAFHLEADGRLFTASRDRTVKILNFTASKEAMLWQIAQEFLQAPMENSNIFAMRRFNALPQRYRNPIYYKVYQSNWLPGKKDKAIEYSSQVFHNEKGFNKTNRIDFTNIGRAEAILAHLMTAVGLIPESKIPQFFWRNLSEARFQAYSKLDYLQEPDSQWNYDRLTFKQEEKK